MEIKKAGSKASSWNMPFEAGASSIINSTTTAYSNVFHFPPFPFARNSAGKVKVPIKFPTCELVILQLFLDGLIKLVCWKAGFYKVWDRKVAPLNGISLRRELGITPFPLKICRETFSISALVLFIFASKEISYSLVRHSNSEPFEVVGPFGVTRVLCTTWVEF